MIKNICHRYKEVIIGIKTETNARCSKCETVFNPHEGVSKDTIWRLIEFSEIEQDVEQDEGL